MAKRIELVLVDPQVDFCDLPGSNLPVVGAGADCERMAKLIYKLGKNIAMIHTTLDSHQPVHIAHPIMWVDKDGKHPGPFTNITYPDIQKGTYAPFFPPYAKRQIEYLQKLEQNGRYPLTVWNPHCLIGTPGWCLHPAIAKAVRWWCELTMRPFSPLPKGSNIFSEHYSAVQADVPDPKDPSTMLNDTFIQALAQADVLLFGGEALDFCVANTMRDIANNFGDDNIKKMRLIIDGTSRVNAPGAEHLADDFLKEMTPRGMQVVKTTDF